MLLSTAVPLSDLTRFCHLAKHGLAAGLSLPDVFRQQADRGPLSLRPICAALTERLERGESLEDALKADGEKLPSLFVTMCSVGEHSGHLPEVFAELGRYFELQWQLRRQFLAAITWPVIEFFAAVGVIALLLLILGMIAPAGTTPLDPIGLGTGVRGAATWLLLVFGILAAVWGGTRLLSRSLRGKATVDRFLLRLPVIGPCLEALALARFCLALRLTLGAGLPVKTAVRRSLDATGNAAYPVRYDDAAAALRRGDDLNTILRACAIFPREFLDIIENAEEGGRTPEVMEKQAQFYQEESTLRLRVLTVLAGVAVFLVVAIIIIVMIFRIFFVAYLGPIQQLQRELKI
jgi:type II secretory pathway component PulF